jgi:hypothetical protein
MKEKMSYLVFILAGIRNKTGRNLATVFCFAFIAVNIFSGQLLMAGRLVSAWNITDGGRPDRGSCAIHGVPSRE